MTANAIHIAHVVRNLCLGLAGLAAPGCAATVLSGPGEEPPQVAGIEACLQRARARLRASGEELTRMRAELTGHAQDDTCRPMNPEAPLSAFEGRWSGRWGEMKVEHLWHTVAPGVQLVLILDGGVSKPGINLREGRLLCGIVIEADGRERLHSGRFVPDRAGRGSHLEWRTERHIYRERVTCAHGQRRYEIHETVRNEDGYEPGVRAHYAPPMPPVQLARGPQ